MILRFAGSACGVCLLDRPEEVCMSLQISAGMLCTGLSEMSSGNGALIHDGGNPYGAIGGGWHARKSELCCFFIRIRACARVFLNCSGEGASKRRMRSCRRAHWRLPCWLNSTCGQASNQLLLVGLESAVLIRKLAAQYTGSPRFIPRAPRQAFKRC